MGYHLIRACSKLVLMDSMYKNKENIHRELLKLGVSQFVLCLFSDAKNLLVLWKSILFGAQWKSVLCRYVGYPFFVSYQNFGYRVVPVCFQYGSEVSNVWKKVLPLLAKGHALPYWKWQILKERRAQNSTTLFQKVVPLFKMGFLALISHKNVHGNITQNSAVLFPVFQTITSYFRKLLHWYPDRTIYHSDSHKTVIKHLSSIVCIVLKTAVIVMDWYLWLQGIWAAVQHLIEIKAFECTSM